MSYYACISKTQRVARKRHHCIWCGEAIVPGATYVREFSKFDGDTQDHRWHPECDGAAVEYFESGEGPEFNAFDNARPEPCAAPS